jgi:hypothetical protein
MADSPLKLRISYSGPFSLDCSHEERPNLETTIREKSEWDALAGEDDPPSDGVSSDNNMDPISESSSAPLTWQDAATQSRKMLTRPSSSSPPGEDITVVLGEGEELYEVCHVPSLSCPLILHHYHHHPKQLTTNLTDRHPPLPLPP